jgi:hypothetical protein
MKKYLLLMLVLCCSLSLAEMKDKQCAASGNMMVKMDKKFAKECQYICTGCGYYNKKAGTCTTCNMTMEKCKDKKACYELVMKKQTEAGYKYCCPKCGAKYPEKGKCTTCGKKLKVKTACPKTAAK